MTKSFQTLKDSIAKGSQKISKATVKAIVNAGEFEKIALGYRYDGMNVTKDTLIENPIEWLNERYNSLSTYINNSKENVVIITLTVHSNLWYYLYVDISKTYEGIEYLALIQATQIADELEKKAEQDAYDKKVQERENAYASNVTTEGIENFKSVNVEDKEIYVIALQPALNKNDWKTDNDQEIDKDSTSIKCKVTDIVYLSKVDYDYFSFNMLTNYSFLEGNKGGTWTNDETGVVEYSAVVCIYCEGQEPILVDPSGYSYARYANRLVKDLDGKLAQEIQSELTVNDNLFIETLEKINNTDLYIFYKGKLWNYLEKSILKDERFIYNKYDSITAITGLSFREMLTSGDGVELNIKPIHFSLDTFIEGVVKFEMGIVKVMFGSSKKSAIDEIIFSERLSRELTRASNVPNPENPITQVVKQYHEETEVISEDPYKQPDIEDGYIYNIHFKAWEKTIEEIEAELTKREILFTNMGDKVGCYNLNIEQAKQVKNISDINGSICFIDSKEPSKALDVQEQPEVPEVFIQASKRQLYALYLGTKIKTTDLVISKDKARELISKSVNGINITEELQAFINGVAETVITETPEALPVVEELKIEEEIVEHMETFNALDDILNKFDSIDVKEIDKISKDDRIYCEMHEKIYKQAYLAYSDVLEKLKNIQQVQKEETKLAKENGILRENDYSAYEYVSEYSDGGTSNIRRSLEKTTQKFISSIVHYFKRTYQIDIKYSEYKDQTELLTLNFVLDKYVFAYLDGFNFQEKAIDEIKQKAKTPQQYYEYRKYWNYEVKGTSIKFKTNIDHIMPALYFYDNNETKVIDCYTHNKIDDYTSYENGNTNIKFLSASYALDFAKRYLGYIEMTEEQREIFKKKASSY